MTEFDYEEAKVRHQAIEMIRPFYTHKNKVSHEDLTVVICQGKKRFLTQLCLESLLRFYPDIKVLVVNGSPDDFDSSNYLHYLALKDNNVEVWDWDGINSHGNMMEGAIRHKVTTEHILLMDNDTIVERGGFIEGMMEQLKDPKMFATGTLMIVSKRNDSCGVPTTEDDLLRHAHPSCSIIKKSMYVQFRPAADHGAPLCYTMADAEKHRMKIGSFPVDEYVSHLSGASWTVPRTIWNNDHNVFIRPFVTFIMTDGNQYKMLQSQHDNDYNALMLGKRVQDSVVIHGQESCNVNNFLFDLRFRVSGEYVCVLPQDLFTMSIDYVTELRRKVVEEGIPDRINVGGLDNVKREVWQQKDCMI